MTEQMGRTGLKRCSWDGFGEVLPDLCLLDFGVVDVDERILGQEVANEGDGSRFTSVACISFKGKPKNCDPLQG
jgi:hypothetical protein